MNPGDTPFTTATRRPGWSALNEGRGMNPGDTTASELWAEPNYDRAQRRPGHEPRRHHRPAHLRRPVLERSTKAGA